MLYQKQVNRLKCSGPAPQYRPLSCSHLVRWSTKISFNIQLINLSQEISHFISAEAKVLIRERIYLTGWLTASVTQSGGDGWEQPIISSKPHSHIVISNHWAQIQNSNKPRGSIVVAGFSSFSSVLNFFFKFPQPSAFKWPSVRAANQGNIAMRWWSSAEASLKLNSITSFTLCQANQESS